MGMEKEETRAEKIATSLKARGKKNMWVLLLFLSVIAVLYFNSLGNDFTNWDDSMIYRNPVIRDLGWKNILEIFTLKKASTYQPIRTLSYAIDYHFWGLNPLGYHLTNLLLYLLTCITVFYTARLVIRGILDRSPVSAERIALFASLLFAAHPVHVEAVTWLAARKEVLQGFFFFLSFFLFMKSDEGQVEGRRWKFLGGVLITFLLAVLSKPSAVVLPAIFLLYEMTRHEGAARSFFRRNWAFLAVSIGFSLVFIVILLKVMTESEQVKALYGGTVGSNLIVACYLLLYNIKLLAFTTVYSAAYTITASFSLIHSRTVLVLGTTTFLFLISLCARKRWIILFFSFFWFVITVLPYLNLIPISTLLADRYAFLPSFSYCLLIGFLLARLYEIRVLSPYSTLCKGAALCLLVLLLSGYAYLTIQQNRVWKNSFKLWSDAVQKYPEAHLANNMMGVLYVDEGKYEKALPYFSKAVEVVPTDIISRNNLAITYVELGNLERALKEFLTILRIRPDDETVKFKVALLYSELNDYQRSREILEELIRRKPNEFFFHLQLGYLYWKMGLSQEALDELETSARINPGSASPYLRMGEIYSQGCRNPDKAIQSYHEATRRMEPSHPRLEETQRRIRELESRR
jgi:Tfp pilus assembly protein PilF